MVSNQRERIIEALAVVCATRGYRATTIEEVIAEAGVSRRTFYDLFDGKQQCFLVAYEIAMGRVLRAVERAHRTSEGSWSERMTSALRALLSLCVAEPDFARLVMVEVLAAGRPALERRDAALSRFERLFEGGATGLPLPDEAARLLARAVIGGLTEILYTRIIAGEAEAVPEAGSQLLYCMLVPYVGDERARAASVAWDFTDAGRESAAARRSDGGTAF